VDLGDRGDAFFGLTRLAMALSSRTMNAIFRTLACVLIGYAFAFAEPPAKTRIVVLDNENLLEGEVSRVEGGYEIRRQFGGDVTIPTNRVLAVVADRKTAYGVVLDRANRRDADERLRMARWCDANGLPVEALAEAKTAARMRPGFAAADRYVAALESAASRVIPMADPEVKQAKAEVTKPDVVTEVPVIDYNSESFPLFASKVNSILLNVCANCHAREDAKVFKLTRIGGRSGVTKNLMAALPQINPKDPMASPLLTKAILPHGTATEAPFKTRNHPAYQALETWVRFARAEEGTSAPEAPIVTEPKKLPEIDKPEAIFPDKPAVKSTNPSSDSFGQDSTTTPKPGKRQPTDPFDPAIFNGQEKKK
jgi:hypothetical protein